jgi:hypothetical protein
MSNVRNSVISQAEWLSRCCSRIAELDSELSARDVTELARALAERSSCRGLAPERAADLLLQNRELPSGSGHLDEN